MPKYRKGWTQPKKRTPKKRTPDLAITTQTLAQAAEKLDLPPLAPELAEILVHGGSAALMRAMLLYKTP